MDMNPTIMEQLEKIIDGRRLKTVFQPVVSLSDGTVLGYEALIPRETFSSGSDQLFQTAAENHRLWDLELLYRTTALRGAFLRPGSTFRGKLFLTVNPNVMHDGKFRRGFTKEYLEQYGIRPENIIFEITERNAISDMNGFRGTVSHYKEQNYRIAVEDAGAGSEGIHLVHHIQPHYIKMKTDLIRNIGTDNIKYTLVKCMAGLSSIAGNQLIAQGVETREELVALVKLGVQYAQGCFLQKPDERIRGLNPAVRKLILECNRTANPVFGALAEEI
jgi:EAL domain-containing protein (putative c-di-GMP-specific phosphodiesterase class I)